MVDMRFLYLIYIPAGLALVGLLLLWWLIETWRDDEE
jgi:hypothetical protein